MRAASNPRGRLEIACEEQHQVAVDQREKKTELYIPNTKMLVDQNVSLK